MSIPAVKAERRIADRKVVDKITVAEVTSLSNYQVIAKEGNIVDASITGFLLSLDRKDILPKELRDHLTLDQLLGQQVVMFLPQMNLDLDGSITRTLHKGGGKFEIAVEFSDEVPEYWRECLIDLLPAPGEIKE